LEALMLFALSTLTLALAADPAALTAGLDDPSG
jgi:hypothetical protein